MHSSIPTNPAAARTSAASPNTGFDFARSDARIARALHGMFSAQTLELTGYWCRIWRARRRAARIAERKWLRLQYS